MSITVLSVELKMHAAGGFNYMRFFWLRNALAFIFWKSHLFRNPRESICKMQSAFSNYLLLKDRTTLEGYRSELKTWFCMKSDYCLLTHCPRKSKFLSETFPPRIPMSLNQMWSSMFVLPHCKNPRVLQLNFSSNLWACLSQIDNIYFSFPLITSNKIKVDMIYTHIYAYI